MRIVPLALLYWKPWWIELTWFSGLWSGYLARCGEYLFHASKWLIWVDARYVEREG
jgi:hypothetical protein